MGRNSRKRSLLRIFTRVVMGVGALTMMGSIPAMASNAHNVIELNVGAAEVLEGFEEIAMNDSSDMSEEESEDEEPESSLVMADVKNSLNVRAEASEEAERVGLLYADCGGEILERAEGWTKIKSGNLIGWASNDYLLFGEEALELAESVGRTLATVNADALRVRKDPSEEAGIWGLIQKDETVEAIMEETTDDWLAIEYEGEIGYISADYVTTEFLVDKGETFEEIKERKKREQEEKNKLIANFGPSAIGTTDEMLLAALVYCEAGNQCYEGKLAVAAVVMNRVRSEAYPDTIAGVIYASGQFTPAGNGKVERRVELGVNDECIQAAREAISGVSNVGTMTHFRRAGNREGYVIQDHVFW